MVIVVNEKEKEDVNGNNLYEFMNIPPDMQKDVGYLNSFGRDRYTIRFGKIIVRSYL
jgi:hypothetical protein